MVSERAAPRGSARMRPKRRLCAARRSMFTLREARAGIWTRIGYRKRRLPFQCSGGPGPRGHDPAGRGLPFEPAKLELADLVAMHLVRPVGEAERPCVRPGVRQPEVVGNASAAVRLDRPVEDLQDRKSTRLNSSHLVISYAVFCLKKNT